MRHGIGNTKRKIRKNNAVEERMIRKGGEKDRRKGCEERIVNKRIGGTDERKG
jgi:hypothetical protein